MNDQLPVVPEGYTTITPWIIVKDAAGFLDWIKDVLGAEELSRILDEFGAIGHAEARIGDAIVMMFDSGEGWPQTPQFLRLYVEDANTVMDKAVAAGARQLTAVTPLAFGDQVGRFVDPWGNTWWIQQRLEDLSWEQMSSRMSEPKYAEAMRYLQRTLREEMRRRGADNQDR
jgi:PhnB protein